MFRRSLFVLLVVGGCGSPFPPPDSCFALSPDTPGAGTVDSLAIGPTEEQLWRPLLDGDFPTLLIDEPCAIIMRLGVTGSPPPDCLAQTTIVNWMGHGQTARDTTPRHTYPQEDGSRRTHDMYLMLGSCDGPNGIIVDVTVIAGQKMITRHFDRTRPPPFDLGVAADLRPPAD